MSRNNRNRKNNKYKNRARNIPKKTIIAKIAYQRTNSDKYIKSLKESREKNRNKNCFKNNK